MAPLRESTVDGHLAKELTPCHLTGKCIIYNIASANFSKYGQVLKPLISYLKFICKYMNWVLFLLMMLNKNNKYAANTWKGRSKGFFS